MGAPPAVAALRERLRRPAPVPAGRPVGAASPSPLRSNFKRAAYLEAVERARRYIAAGDIYQVNL